MIRLIDIIGKTIFDPELNKWVSIPFECWKELFVGEKIGYYCILAIDYPRKRVLLRYLHIGDEIHQWLIVEWNKELKKLWKFIDA